jgi:hypothetical protein
MNRKTLRMVGLLFIFWTLILQVPLYAKSDGTVNQYPTPPTVVTGYPQVVVVAGTNYEMGYQYGQQAGPVIYRNKQEMTSNLYKMYTQDVVDNDIRAWNYYLQQYDPKFPDWLNGISAGCKSLGFDVSYYDLVLMVIYPEELWARPSYPYPAGAGIKTKKGSTPQANNEKADMCSSFAAYGPPTGNKAVVTITAGADSEVDAQVILIAFPSEGNKFISFPFAGEITANQAFTDKFGWVEPAAPTWDCVWGIAPEVYFHWITQYAASVDDALHYLETTPRAGVTGNFLFAEQAAPGATGRIKALEANYTAYAERDPGTVYPNSTVKEGPNFLIMENNFINPNMLQYNGYGPAYPMSKTDGNWYRYYTLFQWLNDPSAQTAGAMTLDWIKGIWKKSDWYDYLAIPTPVWHTNDPGNSKVPGNGAKQHLHIYYPADKTAYMQYGYAKGVGPVPNNTGEYSKFVLLDTPLAVMEQANKDADKYCSTANTRYLTLTNANKLTDAVFKQQVLDLLNEGYMAVDAGLQAEANAYYGKTARIQNAWYANAITLYSTAQLKCQQVTTQLAPY